MNISFTPREQIIEVINRLFFYTDYRKWQKLKEEVFSERVELDMTSLGEKEVENLSSQEICDKWDEALKGIDAVHHQPGNYMVRIGDNEAEVIAYSTATHYKQLAFEGNLREFVGSYEIHLIAKADRWKIDKLRFNLKYMHGNIYFK